MQRRFFTATLSIRTKASRLEKQKGSRRAVTPSQDGSILVVGPLFQVPTTWHPPKSANHQSRRSTYPVTLSAAKVISEQDHRCSHAGCETHHCFWACKSNLLIRSTGRSTPARTQNPCGCSTVRAQRTVDAVAVNVKTRVHTLRLSCSRLCSRSSCSGSSFHSES
jgi:hypothetical protein